MKLVKKLLFNVLIVAIVCLLLVPTQVSAIGGTSDEKEKVNYNTEDIISTDFEPLNTQPVVRAMAVQDEYMSFDEWVLAKGYKKVECTIRPTEYNIYEREATLYKEHVVTTYPDKTVYHCMKKETVVDYIDYYSNNDWVTNSSVSGYERYKTSKQYRGYETYCAEYKKVIAYYDWQDWKTITMRGFYSDYSSSTYQRVVLSHAYGYTTFKYHYKNKPIYSETCARRATRNTTGWQFNNPGGSYNTRNVYKYRKIHYKENRYYDYFDSMTEATKAGYPHQVGIETRPDQDRPIRNKYMVKSSEVTSSMVLTGVTETRYTDWVKTGTTTTLKQNHNPLIYKYDIHVQGATTCPDEYVKLSTGVRYSGTIMYGFYENDRNKALDKNGPTIVLLDHDGLPYFNVNEKVIMGKVGSISLPICKATDNYDVVACVVKITNPSVNPSVAIPLENLNKAGTYLVTYSASDSKGNKAIPVEVELQLAEGAVEPVTNILEFKQRYGSLLDNYASKLGIDVNVLGAIVFTESSGGGFYPNGSLKIRFEDHIFYGSLGGAELSTRSILKQYFIHAHPDYENEKYRWTLDEDSVWLQTHIPGNQQFSEYDVFALAKSLDEDAAYNAISMGFGQVMGFNAWAAGYSSAKEMYNDFSSSEQKQIEGMMSFIEKYNGGSLHTKLRNGDIDGFGKGYNGSGNYADKIKKNIELYKNTN